MENNNNIISVLKGCSAAGVSKETLQPIINKAIGRYFETEYQFWLSVMGDACKKGVVELANKLLGLKKLTIEDLKTEEDFTHFLRKYPVDVYVHGALYYASKWTLPSFDDLELYDGTPWPDQYRKAKALYQEYSFRRDVRHKLFNLYLPWHNLYETVDNPDELQLEQYITMFIADLEEDLQKKEQK